MIHLNYINTVLFVFRSVIDPPVVVSQTCRKITCGNWFLPVENVRECGNRFLPVGVCERMCGNWFLHVTLLVFVRGCAATGSFPDLQSEYVRECVENGSNLLFCWRLWKNVRQLVATCWNLWGNVWQLVSSRMSLWENVFDYSGTTKLRTESAAQQSGYTRQHCPSQVLLSRFCQGLYNRYVMAAGLILQYISVHQRR